MRCTQVTIDCGIGYGSCRTTQSCIIGPYHQGCRPDSIKKTFYRPAGPIVTASGKQGPASLRAKLAEGQACVRCTQVMRVRIDGGLGYSSCHTTQSCIIRPYHQGCGPDSIKKLLIGPNGCHSLQRQARQGQKKFQTKNLKDLTKWNRKMGGRSFDITSGAFKDTLVSITKYLALS